MTPLLAIRVIVLALALFNMWWTGRLTLSLACGRWSLRAVYRSVLFFLAAGSVAFLLFAIFGTPTEATRTGSSCLLAIGFGLGIVVWRQIPRFDLIDGALDHIGEAMAIVDLARVDLEAALRIADECRRLTAVKVMISGR